MQSIFKVYLLMTDKLRLKYFSAAPLLVIIIVN